jgi:hypothetical protein
MATKKQGGKYVVVRTYSAGVHVGELVSRKGQEVTLANARRIWRWFGANTLNEVATTGIDSAKSRVSVPVASIEITQAIEIIPATKAAQASIEAAKWAP